MNQIERHGDSLAVLRLAVESARAKVMTALPGIIQSIDMTAMTCVVQPAIQGSFRDREGKLIEADLPLLLDCPVQFPGGGGCTLTFPVEAGDECLVVYSSRCIDSWWQSGGVQPPASHRMLDRSDGFAFLGFRSQPRVLKNVSTSAAQLRADDGSTFVEVQPGGAVVITAPSGLTINANVKVNGNVEVTGNVSAEGDVSAKGNVTADGDVMAGDITLKTHKHAGVTQGGDNSGTPVP